MGFFTTDKTTTVTVEGVEVTLRKLNEGDKLDRLNLLNMGEGGIESVAVGELLLFDLTRSIVSWSLPEPVTDENVRRIDPDVADKLREAISELNPALFATDPT